MSTTAEKLQKWSVQELNLASESGLRRIPDAESLSAVTKGKHKKRLWTYVINHVRSQATVDKIKRTLQLKKILEENEGNIAFNDESTDVVQLQAAILKATEKRTYLMQSLSTVKERILNLEEKVQNTKDKTFQINQKTALLEFVKQMFGEKNINLRALFTHILAFKDSLNAYQAAKVCDKAVTALPYDFLFENRALYDENYSRIKDLINVSSSILKNNFSQQNEKDDALIENFQNNIHALKKNGVLLTDLVILLKEISGSELQQFMSVESVSVKDFMSDKSKKTESNVLLSELKCDHLYTSLSSIKNKEKIEKLILKKEIYENKIKNEFNVDTCTLIGTLAENEALMVSNNYLKDNLEHMSNKTHLILKSIRQQKLCSLGLYSVIQTFYSSADIVFHLLYTYSDSVQKTVDNLNTLRQFAQNELFESPFPQKECLEELKDSFVLDRRLTWEYCARTNCIRPLLSEPHIFNLSSEIQNSLHFQPFQNTSVLCEDWVQFKQKLRAEVIAQSEVFVQNIDISVPEFYKKILKLLDTMKVSLEKAVVFINGGLTHCQKNKSLIQEWWGQNAQYIPRIEYKGKTLKMWIDILSVLSDFEPQSYA